MKLTTWNPEERVNIEQVRGVNKTTFKVYARLPNGKVVRQRFNTEAKAIVAASDLKIQGLNIAKAKAQNIRPSSLSATQEGDYLTAIEILNKKFGEDSWNLTKAATWVSANWSDEAHTDIKVKSAVDEFLKWKKKEGAKPNYLSKARNQFGFIKSQDKTTVLVRDNSFVSLDLNLDEVTVDDVDRIIWNEAWEVSSSTRRDYWKSFHVFFEWATGKYCRKNIIKNIAKPAANELDPEAFTVDQAQNIIETAQKCYNGSLVPYFALALFAGLRPQEITGNESIKPLRWDEHFVWDKDDKGNDKVSIRLRGKMAWRRTVLLPDNCLAWIKPYAKKKGPVCPTNFEKKYDVVRCAAGFKVGKGRIAGIDKKGIDGLEDPYSKDRPEWIQDGCRHSALSYRLAIVEDIPAVCAWAGNSPRTFKSNYEALVTKEQAKKYWEIYP